MPSFCAVSNCELKYSHSENISFHKFPFKYPKILAQWIQFANRGSQWKPSPWNSICSRHFDKSCFREYLSRKCLKKGAIPSINTKSNVSYETYHISTCSNDDARSSEQFDNSMELMDKTASEEAESCRLCGERVDTLTCDASRSLDEPEINSIVRKCFPSIIQWISPVLSPSRHICTDCVIQMRQYSDFIEKVQSYQRELGLSENIGCYAISEYSIANESRLPFICNKPSTLSPNPPIVIKQEPINVKQEFVERRPMTSQVPSPTLCVNSFNENIGLVQQEKVRLKTESNSTYCGDCDRIFANNYEFRSHNCLGNSEQSTDREGNNCEIMEVITLNNPVSFIDLADDEIATGVEQRKPKAEVLGEFERQRRLEFEHAYAKRASNPSCNLKQEIIDSCNDASQTGYDNDQAESEEPTSSQIDQSEDEGRSFDCANCSQSFSSLQLLGQHTAKVHECSKFCSICNLEFETELGCRMHKTRMHTLRHTCRRCKQKFHSQSFRRLHERRCGQHFSKEPRDCRSRATRTSIQVQQPDVTDYFCNICDESFSEATVFRQHIELHERLSLAAQEAQVKFGENDSKAATSMVDNSSQREVEKKGNFETSHDASHVINDNASKLIFISDSETAEVSEIIRLSKVCQLCDKEFPTYPELRKHLDVHRSSRSFNCSLCPKVFKTLSGMRQHINGFHYKIKPYSCTVCGYSYALKGDMKRCAHSKLAAHKTGTLYEIQSSPFDTQ